MTCSHARRASLLGSAAAAIVIAASTAQAQEAEELPTITVQAPQQQAPSTAEGEGIAGAGEAQEPVTQESAWGPVDGIVATRSATGTKTDTPLIETPQSISVVTADQMEVQGAQDVSQALRYVPGTLVQPQGASSVYDETHIRGFTPRYYLDGLAVPFNQFWAAPRFETYGLERLEVLKGPSSVLYGQNEPGGLINMVSKRPTEKAFGEVELQTGSYDRLQGAFDIGGPVDPSGSLLYRMTFLARDADTAIDFTRDDRLFVAPALTWRPSADTNLTFLAAYGKDEADYPHQYLPAQGTLLHNPNGRISRSLNVGEPDWDTFEREQWWVGYAFDHRINDTWKLRQNLRYAGVDVVFNSTRAEALDPNDLRTLNRSAFTLDTDAETFTVDNQAEAKFTTGALGHTLLFGLDYLRTSGNQEMDAVRVISSIDIYDPVYGQPFPDFVPFMSNYQSLSQLGLYAQDQIKFDRWVLTLGGRYDWAETESDDKLSGVLTQLKDEAFSGRAGLTYLFDNGLVPYFSYATSFLPQVGVDAAGNPFDPTTGEQYEVGVKYQPPGSDMLLTFAAFDLTRQKLVTEDPATFLSRQGGEARVRGIELEGKVSVTDRLDLIASYSYLDSEITKSENQFEVGRSLYLTPEHQASAWLDYTFDSGPLTGFRLGGGVRYVGEYISQTIEEADPIVTPDYTLFDAMASYDLGTLSPRFEGTEIALNFTNLTDEYYVTYCYDNRYCSLGEGRTVLTTLKYRW